MALIKSTPISKVLFSLVLLVASLTASATNYYSGASGDPTVLANWWTNTNGTGSHPANFTGVGDVFFIQNTHTMTTAATAWTVSGTVDIQNGGVLLVNGSQSHSLGSLVVESGGIASVNRPFTVTGAAAITGEIDFGSTNGTSQTMTFTGAVTLNSGTVWNETTTGAAANFSFGNSLTNNASTFTTQNTAHNFTGAGATLSGSTSISIPTATFTGAYTNNGTFTSSTLLTVTGVTLTNNGTITAATALSGSGGVTQGAAGVLNIGGTSGITTLDASTNAGNTVNYNGGAAQTLKDINYSNLTISNSNTATWNLGGARTIGANLTINSGSTLTLANNQTLGVTGSTSVTGTFNLGGTSAKTFTGDVSLNSGSTWNETGAAPINFNGNFTNNASTFTANTGTHTFGGTSKTVSGSTTTAIPTATFTGAYTNSGTITSATLLTVTAVTLTNNGTITANTALSGTGGVTQGASGVLNLGGTSGITTLTATAAGNTVNYSGASQAIHTGSYYNLSMTGSGTPAFSVATAIAGNFSVISGPVVNLGLALAHTAGSLTLAGADQPSGTYTAVTSPAFFSNTGSVTVSSCASGFWLGTTNTDWNTASNWCGNAVPGSSTNVTIPSGGNQPIIGAAGGLCNNITINSGATLTITGSNSLIVSGNWTNSGTFTANTSTVTFNGTTSIAGASTTTFKNVLLNGSGSVTTGAAVTIGGTLNISDGTIFTAAAVALTVTGATTIGNGASGNLTITSATGAKTFTGLVTVAAGGTWTNTAANSPVIFQGGITNNGTFNAGTGLHTFNTNAQALSGTLSIPSATVAIFIVLTNNNTLNIGTSIAGAGTIAQAANAVLNIGGTSTITTLTATGAGNLVNYNGAAQTVHSNTYQYLTLSGSGAKTLQAGTTSIGGDLTLSGTATTTTVVGLTISGNVNLGDGTTLTVAGFPIAVSGATNIGTGVSATSLIISSATGAKTFSGLVTIASLGVWNNSGASPVTFNGGITNNGTFTASAAVNTFDTNNQALTGTFAIPNATVNVITLTNNNTLTVSTALSGTGGLTQASNSTLNIGGTSGITTLIATNTGNLVNYTGAAQTVNSANYYNLNLSGSGTDVLQSGTTSVAGNLAVSGTVSTTTVVGLVIGGNLSLGNGTSLTAAGFNFTVTGTTTVGGGTTGSLIISASAGTKIFTGLVTVAAGATWNNSGNSNVTFRGGITNAGTFTAGTGLYTFDTNSQTITGTISIPSVTATAVTLTNNGTLTINTALSGTGGLTQATGSTLVIGGTSAITTLDASTNVNTVNFNASAVQTVNAVNYSTLLLGGTSPKTLSAGTTTVSGNLTLSGSVTITPVGGLTIGGTITLGAGTTFTGGSFTHNIAGNWTNNGGTFTNAGSTINFNGAAQNINGSTLTAFNNLTISTGANVALNALLHTAVTLTLGGAPEASGTWGGTGSGATNINTTFFAAGTGTVNVSTSGCAAGSNVWIGKTSTAWNTTTNWCSGAVPVAATNVIIPAGTPFAPTINVAAFCNNITINSGATLTGGAALTFTVSGSWSNSGTYAPSTSTVTFNGTSPAIGGSSTTTFNNLNLNTAGATNLTVNTSIIVNNNIAWTTDGLLVVSTTSNVTLGSAATISAPSSTRYIQLDGLTGSNSNLIKTSAGTTASWAILYPVGTSNGGYTPVDLTGGLTNAPTNSGTTTLSVKVIYNNSDQGQLRRVFRFVSANNASATFFTNGKFTYNNSTDISTGDSEQNYSSEWYLAASSASAAWSIIGTISPTVSSPFTIAGGSAATASLATGTYYYTLGQSSAYPNTWYSYQSGNWSNWQNWTSDPSGTSLLNGLNLPPQPGDAIVILNGITITNDQSGQATTSATINSGATLDMAATTGNTLGTVSGSGTLRINGINLPTGTYTSFVSSAGGTVEYYNTGGAVSATQLTYNNLKFSNSTSSAVIFSTTITATPYTLTINGNLNINATGSGTVTWQINGNTGAPYTVTNPQVITIAGDLNISSNGKIVAGTGHSGANTPHSLTLSGNLTNNGVVQFFDPTQSPFNASNTSTTVTNAALQGNAVVVTFSGATSNTITCNGQTDFYRFVENKGTGTSAILNVNSSSTANFRLFGPANQGSSGQTSTDYSLCALSIINGTLEFTGSISIPTLIENGPASGTSTDNWSLPVSGELWLNGSGVSITMTSDNLGNNDDQRLNCEGVLLVSNGTFNAYQSKGIGSGTAGSVIVQGGTVNISQFRPRGASTSQAFAYSQSGGTVNIGTTGYNGTPNVMTNAIDNAGYGRISIPVAGSTFQMSGGILNIGTPTANAPGGIDISSSTSNYAVTGGTINGYIPNGGNNFTINSTAPFYNLNIYDEGAGATAQLQAAQIILNNMTIVTSNTPTFACNNFNLTIGGNFTINSATTFTPGTNTLTFNGTGAQTWTNNGTITSLNTVVVSKGVGTVLTLAGSTLPNIPTLTLTSGTLADGGSTVTVTSALTNNATHTSTGAGNITASGPTAIGGSNGTFGNLTITTNNSVSTAGAQTITGNLRLIGTNTSLNIGSNALTVSGNIYTDASTGVAFSSTRRILTSGLHNAGGLTRQGVSSNLLFPVGSSAVGANAAVGYTPITITVTATIQGTITVRPVNSEHPNVTATSQSLAYYWRVTSSGFSGITAVTHKNYTFSSATKNGTLTSYRSARYDRSANSWGTNNTTYNATGTTIIPNFNTGTNWTGVASDQLDGEYTCGNIAAFGAITVYYSRVSGPWNVNGTWSTVAVGGVAAASNPTSCSFCPVVIGDGASNNHIITIDANGRTCGSLALNSGSTLDCSTFTSLNFGTSTGGLVSGTGWLRIASANFPAGDFTNFLGSNGGTVEWYGSTATIPSVGPAPQNLSLNAYYNLVINPSAANTLTFPASDLTIYNNLTQGDATYSSYTGTAVTNGAHTYTIAGNLTVSNGTFNFANVASSATTVNLSGNLVNNGIFSVASGGSANANSISITGGITNAGTMNFNNTGVVNLTFSGTNSVSFTNSGTATLNSVTVNKGTSQANSVTLSGAGTVNTTATSAGWLTVSNGSFIFNNTGGVFTISNSILSGYTIPSTANLTVQTGSVTILSGNNTSADLFLNGSLTVSGGTVNVGVSPIDNDIEYASSGSPTINVSSAGSLNVNGSIRRSITTLTGALVYNQTGGSVTVGGNSSDNTRGVFEIDFNTGSSFTLTGTGSLTVQRQTGGSTYADLYLNPVTSNVSATSTITMGLGTVATNTGMRVNISPAIGNFIVAGGANAQTVKLYSNPLVLGGSLTVTSPSSLDTNPLGSANGLNVSIAGNLNLSGTASYLGSANTTTFNGTTATNQTASLTGSPTAFNNMTINNTGGATVILSGTAPTLTNLNILKGTLDVGNFALMVNGDIVNNSSQIASANGGGGSITLTTATSASHTITSSNGSFTNLKVGGATATTNNLVTVNGNTTINGYLDFVSGSTTVTRTLFIGSSLLTISSGTAINNVGNFRFIKTNGVSSDQGVIYTWPASAGVITFTYPVGTRTNYTPVTMSFNSITTGGNYTVVPVDGQHPTASPSGQDLLAYYWKVINSGVVNSTTGTLTFTFPTALIAGTGVGTGFNGAYLDLGASTLSNWGWQLNGSSGLGGSFQFTGPFSAGTYPGSYPTAEMPTSGFEFDYTCGTSATLPNPIAPVYSRFGTTSPINTTNVGTLTVGGNWSLATNWTTSSTGYGGALSSVPTGVPVVILSGARINMDASGQSAFSTQVSGLLVVNFAGESLGTISGTGTMRTTNSKLPAGTYTTFTNSGGGTIEYATTMTMDSRTTYNNLLISTDYVTLLPSTVTMTSSNLTVNGNLTLSAGNTLDDSANGSGQGGLAITGTFSNSGTYNAGTSTAISVTGGLTNSGTYNAASSVTSITGTLANTGTFSGGSGTVNLAGNLSNSGTFNAGTGTVSFNGTAAQTITGATTFNNLTMNNTFGTSPQLTISSGNQTVNSILTLTAGNINLNSTNITLGASCASPGTLALSASPGWVYGGSFTRYFTTTAIPDGSNVGYFPVGNSTDYRPFYIGVPAGDMTTCGTFTVSVNSATNTTIVNIADNNGNSAPTPIVGQYQGYWSVSSSGIAGGTYDLTAGGTGFGTIGSLTDLSLCLANSVVGVYSPATNTTSDPRLNRTGISFANINNQFYVGSTNISRSPLPIELLSFSGVPKKYGVDLQWKTASEINNDYFTVLRSPSGANFQAIGTVKGNGTTNSEHSYLFTDFKPNLGNNYYQLMQTDFDGNNSSSETIIVNVLSLEPLLSVYPNPLSQNQLLNVVINGLQASSPTEIQIIDVEGIKVNGATINTDSDGSLRTSVSLKGLSAGMYILKVQNVHYKFIIE